MGERGSGGWEWGEGDTTTTDHPAAAAGCAGCAATSYSLVPTTLSCIQLLSPLCAVHIYFCTSLGIVGELRPAKPLGPKEGLRFRLPQGLFTQWRASNLECAISSITSISWFSLDCYYNCNCYCYCNSAATTTTTATATATAYSLSLSRSLSFSLYVFLALSLWLCLGSTRWNHSSKMYAGSERPWH